MLLGEHGEGHTEVHVADASRRLLVLRRLSEVVRRHTENLEASVLVRLVKRFQPRKLPGETAVAGGVNDHHGFARERIAQVDALRGPQLAHLLVEKWCASVLGGKHIAADGGHQSYQGEYFHHSTPYGLVHRLWDPETTIPRQLPVLRLRGAVSARDYPTA